MTEYDLLFSENINKVSKKAKEGTPPWVLQAVIHDPLDGENLLVVIREDYPHEVTQDAKLLLPHQASRKLGMNMGGYLKGAWLKPKD